MVYDYIYFEKTYFLFFFTRLLRPALFYYLNRNDMQFNICSFLIGLFKRINPFADVLLDIML